MDSQPSLAIERGHESLKYWNHHGEDGQSLCCTQFHACIGRFNGAVTYHVQLLLQNIMLSLKIKSHGE